MATQTATELLPLEPPIAVSGSESRSHDPNVDFEDSSAVATADEATTTNVVLPKGRAVIVITQVCGVQFFSSFCSGILVIALPAIQSTLSIEQALLVWPTSSYYLAAGSCLLLTGAIADVTGPKRVNLVGCFLGAVSALACGLSQSGGEIIAFRAIQGVTNAIQTPSSISIISSSVEDGQPRNIGLSCLGLSLPFGFGFGLVLAGVLTDTVGWRPAFYLAAAASLVLSVIGIWALPKDSRPDAGHAVWKRMISEIDWVGLMLATTGLATLSYVLASLSADINSIHNVANIVLLAISVLSIPSYVAWMHRQVKLNRTALIPNALWRSHVFTSCCIMVLLTNALTNCMELYSSLL
ncbi:hypothetical protein N0V93_009325 [Gnomoniopsis smithogilvyi]|uniref:Major facilitator superfamily (MFS) profile domain-containing protein n=1 Tax=Gnomoniopsis smithogilvyi TaxID=1191159 RepID=A0A9W8YJG8_9PEZI|nr:hypothetical protein N0V93_009325 [Gnomoniopsis smithogilvyi]